MLEQALVAHDWVEEARLAVIQENRASLGALLVLSAAGLHALRNQGRRALTEGLRQHLSQHCEALALPDAGGCCGNCRSTPRANCPRPSSKPCCWHHGPKARKC